MSILSYIKNIFFKKKKDDVKKVFVHKDGVNKVIFEYELEDYFAQGYYRGRAKKKKK